MGDMAQLSDKVLPHNSEAEQACLGAVIMDNEAYNKAIMLVRPPDFYRQAHRIIFEAIIGLTDKATEVDLLTITDALQAQNKLDLAGGPGYIAELTSKVPTVAHVEQYARIVREMSLRRQMLRMAQEISADAHELSVPLRAVMEETEKRVYAMSESQGTITIQTAREVVGITIENITHIVESKKSFTGIASGLVDLDNYTSGFQKSEFIVVGARPSMGKTALALTMAADIAVKQKIPTGFFSLEMASTAIMQRMLSMYARIDGNALRTGMLRNADLMSMVDAAGPLYDAPLYISDQPDMPLLDLRSLSRRMVSQFGVKIIFIDYLTLIKSEQNNTPRHEQVAEISRSLKAMARELEIPVVVLSQVSRDSEGKAPTLNNLRESGSIEQDADVVIFLHRDRTGGSEDGRMPEVIDTQLIIAKQRNGPIGTVNIAFRPSYTTFENLDHSPYG